MKNRIWRMKEGICTDVVNLTDFKGAADCVLPEHFSSKQNLLEVLRCICAKAGVENTWQEMLFDLTLPMRFKAMQETESWLRGCKMTICSIGGGRYLNEPVDGYIESAKAVILREMKGSSESERSEAFAYLVLLSCGFAQKAEVMKPVTIGNLLSSWRKGRQIRRIEGGERFKAGFDVVENAPLIRRMLINDSGIPASFFVVDPQGNEHQIWMPPHTRRLALFAGDRLTCIKGIIAHSSNHARALAGGQMQYAAANSSMKIRLSSASEDLADYDDEEGCSLHGATLVHDEEKTEEHGVLTFCRIGIRIVYVKEDGTLFANFGDLTGRKALCILRDGEHLHAVLRGGEVVSTAAQAPSGQEILSRMLARFGANEFAERVEAEDGAFVLTRNGELRYIQESGAAGR